MWNVNCVRRNYEVSHIHNAGVSELVVAKSVQGQSCLSKVAYREHTYTV